MGSHRKGLSVISPIINYSQHFAPNNYLSSAHGRGLGLVGAGIWEQGELPLIKQPGSGLAPFYTESHVVFGITWEVLVTHRTGENREDTQLKWVADSSPTCRHRST